MKKIFTFCFIILVTKTWSQSPCVFSIINMYSPGVYSITCGNPTLNLTANPANNTYTWVSLTNTLTGSNVGITGIGNYTITCSGIGCTTSTQTLSVGLNTLLPTNSVTPTSQAITCSSNSAVTFSGTVSNPTVNMQHDWYSPLNPLPGGVPIATSNNTLSILSGLVPPGIYTLVTTNLINGCKAQKTFTVTSLDAFPTFSVYSPTNFSIGCSPLNQTTISIINPVSTQTPAATCSYTFLSPSFVGVVTPSVVLGNNTSTLAYNPGTWTVIVQDNNNFCRTRLTVPITQNTMAPDAGVSMLSRTLTCINPTLLATGTTTSLNTMISWNIPAVPPLLSTSTVEVGPSNGPPTSTTSLTYANYTVIATNTLNACLSTSVVSIYQNFKPPISTPTMAIGTPTAICNSNPVILTTGNSTTTSGGGPTAFIIPLLWEGPVPQATATGVSSYSCFVPGTYSLTVKDNYNGCTSIGTINVLSYIPVFSLQGMAPTSSVSCNGSIVVVPIPAVGYSISVSTGSLSGNNITNLCYGKVVVCLTNTNTGCKKCDSLDINSATTIKELIFENEFILYPNPTNSTFYIKNTSQKSGTIKVFNVEGKEMETLVLESVASSASASEVKNLNSGIYFVEIRIENSVVRKKVVVIK